MGTKNQLQMLKLAALVILLLGTLAIAATSSDIPECNDHDCPAYTVIDQSGNFEVRSYRPALWARTMVQSDSYEKAAHIGFNRLLEYISGANEDKTEIAMAAPVTVQIIPGSSMISQSTFIVSFYVADNYQAPNPRPPRPTNPEVFIERLPATTKAVYMFPGMVTKWSDLVVPSEKLAAFIQANGLFHGTEIETFAGYDSPFVLRDRHNEIWMDVWGSASQ